MADSLPTLWQIDVSHYSEKARWALDYKEVHHVRRSPIPGLHMVIARRLTNGERNTFPVLELDGRVIGDSTAIIAALEERHPDNPLYPSDPEQRRRALELEDYFDEELGPPIRLLAWHHLGNDPAAFAAMMGRMAPPPMNRLPRATAAYGRAFTGLRYSVRSAEAAEQAETRVLAALERLEAELGDNEYLVGDSFSSADLTAAALFYPMATPEEGPLPSDEAGPEGMERFREPLKERSGYRWVKEIFHRHRRPASKPSAEAVGAQ